jgi:hypothetical protein
MGNKMYRGKRLGYENNGKNSVVVYHEMHRRKPKIFDVFHFQSEWRNIGLYVDMMLDAKDDLSARDFDRLILGLN